MKTHYVNTYYILIKLIPEKKKTNSLKMVKVLSHCFAIWKKCYFPEKQPKLKIQCENFQKIIDVCSL